MRNREETLRVAVLNLYNGIPNQGIRCIRELLNIYCTPRKLPLELCEYDVRGSNEMADEHFDIYISSGGPGSPLESGGEWENRYFSLISRLEEWNNSPSNIHKKHVLFICHSFQLMCRYYQLSAIRKRRSASFGVFPVHLTKDGHEEAIFETLPDPFYAMDSREWQVVQPNHEIIGRMNASILAIEKERPHVPLERAVMAIRFSPCFLGVQFHPEADAVSIRTDLLEPEKKRQVISEHGIEKYENMLAHLDDPDKIMLTQQTVIPKFLDAAINHYPQFAL